MDKVNEWLLKQAAPKVYDGGDTKNVLVESERSFLETCNFLEELGIPNPEQLTAYKFYSKIKYLNQKAEKQKQANKNK